MSEFSVPTVQRINYPNAPADSIVVQTVSGTRVAIKKAHYNQLKNDIINAGEQARRGVHEELSYQAYVAQYPWAVLVFPLLWKEMPEVLESYTDYDPTGENCIQQVEDIAIKIMTARARRAGR